MINETNISYFLFEMKSVYDTVLRRNAAEVHNFFVEEEHKYVHSKETNFAHTVHMLHPSKYQADSEKFSLYVYLQINSNFVCHIFIH